MFVKRLKIQNYRTLEDFEVTFLDFYTAICGKNNSGKSNITRCLRFLLSPQPDFPWDDGDDEVQIKRDFTQWKRECPVSEQHLLFEIELEFTAERDMSLVNFVDRLASTDTSPSPVSGGKRNLVIQLKITPADRETLVTATLNGNDLDKIASDELLAKLRSSTTLVYHDSTSTHHRAWRHRIHGLLEDLPGDDQDKLRKKHKTLTNAMKGVLKKEKEELNNMIGRLGEKYEVDLSMPDVSFLSVPFGISLGEKDFSIPLDEWGSGTKNQTLILKRMFDARRAAEKPSTTERLTPIIIIEEPEAFLHPLAQAQFGRVLQDLANELQTQIVATTHSPYMLSHREPRANVLLERRVHKGKKLRDTQVVSVDEPNWKKPFEQALGVVGPEFDIFKEALFSNTNAILLVEGDTDRQYLELLCDEKHGTNQLHLPGEIYSYGGYGTLQQSVLLKFIKERFAAVVVTVDLDALSLVEKNLRSLGFERDVSLLAVGEDRPGFRAIEGLLPDRVRQAVRNRFPELSNALESNDKEEVKQAKQELKKMYLEEFSNTATTGSDYEGLYRLGKSVSKAFAKQMESSRAST